MQYVFKLTIGNANLQEIDNDNEAKAVSFAASKNPTV
jgi:hypothetical protein